MSRHLKFRHSATNKVANQKPSIPVTGDNSKVKFSEISKGEVKKILVYIDPSMRNKFGRRASVCESILGASVSPFPDGQRIMIAGYMPNSYLSQEKIIKVGDWLKAINDQDVTAENVDLLLLSFTEPTQVELTLQRMSGEEPTHSDHSLTNKLTNLSDFVVHAEHVFHCDVNDVDDNGLFNVLYVTMNGFDEQNVSLYYPEKSQNCKIYLNFYSYDVNLLNFIGVFKSRGSFLTLHSLLATSFNSAALSTTISINNVDLNVLYRTYDEGINLINFFLGLKKLENITSIS